MKKIALILAVLTLLPLAQSCDFFRKIAGRPTSVEIEAIREMERELEEFRNRRDSIEMENQRIVDSISNVGAARTKKEETVTPVISTPVPTPTPATKSAEGERSLYNLSTIPYKHYVVVGTFSEFKNAEKKLREIEKQGYQGDLIAYHNGFTAVGICPSDDLQEVKASLRKIKQSGICREAWIVTKQ